MAYVEEDGLKIYYMALHSKVLIAYVCDPDAMDYSAYCFPVRGISHGNEYYLWRTEGEKLSSAQASGMWTGLTEQLEREGYVYRG